MPNPKMTVEKPFGKAAFGGGDYAKTTLLLKRTTNK